MSTLSVRLEKEFDIELDRLARRERRSKSDLVRELLRRQLALEAFDEARARLMPKAEQAGYLTDEDVFRDAS